MGNGKASALKSAALGEFGDYGDGGETGALARATSIDVAVPAQSKGRLIRCAVPGSTPKRLAIFRTPTRRGIRASKPSTDARRSSWR